MKLRNDEADARLARTPLVLAYLPWILRYPLTGFCLPVILMVALFLRLSIESLFGLPLLTITLIWALFYLQSIIAHSAKGHATPPPMSGEVTLLDPRKIAQMLALPLLVMSAATLLVKQGQAQALPPLLAFAAFVMPAYLLILATENDVWAALNPLRGLQVIAAMGLPYLSACLLLAGAAAATWWLADSLAFTVFVALSVYLLYLVGHLLGYLAYHRAQQLGLDVEVRHPDVVAREQEQKDRIEALLVRVENCLLNKDERGAVREIEAETGGPVSVRQSFEDLFTRLLARGTPALQHAAGRRLITALLAEQRKERALEVAETCLNKNAHFEPATVLELEQLARQALAGKYFQLFERLLHHLDERYPGDPILVTSQFLRAQIRAEHQNDEAGALALLQPLLAHTNHPLHGRIAGFARALQNLQERRTRR